MLSIPPGGRCFSFSFAFSFSFGRTLKMRVWRRSVPEVCCDVVRTHIRRGEATATSVPVVLQAVGADVSPGAIFQIATIRVPFPADTDTQLSGDSVPRGCGSNILPERLPSHDVVSGRARCERLRHRWAAVTVGPARDPHWCLVAWADEWSAGGPSCTRSRGTW
jgi:hypothetical protein